MFHNFLAFTLPKYSCISFFRVFSLKLGSIQIHLLKIDLCSNKCLLLFESNPVNQGSSEMHHRSSDASVLKQASSEHLLYHWHWGWGCHHICCHLPLLHNKWPALADAPFIPVATGPVSARWFWPLDPHWSILQPSGPWLVRCVSIKDLNHSLPGLIVDESVQQSDRVSVSWMASLPCTSIRSSNTSSPSSVTFMEPLTENESKIDLWMFEHQPWMTIIIKISESWLKEDSSGTPKILSNSR